MTSARYLALIIEDDNYLAEIFSKAFESVGYQTDIRRDGRAALDRLNEVTPTIITLDMHLPHVSGREILRHIKREPRLAETRIILTTADAATASAVGAEADLVLLKPISFSQLRALANRLRPSD
jgi:CheY-like chemotaxis protein